MKKNKVMKRFNELRKQGLKKYQCYKLIGSEMGLNETTVCNIILDYNPESKRAKRNVEIAKKYISLTGTRTEKIEKLAKEYHRTYDTVYKIICNAGLRKLDKTHYPETVTKKRQNKKPINLANLKFSADWKRINHNPKNIIYTSILAGC